MGLMNARRLILAAVVSLCSLTAGGLLAAPVALGEELCPNAASRQGPSAALPDCRAYELVTPANKGDATDMFGTLEGEQSTGDPAEDSNHFLLNTFASFSGGDTVRSSYVFTRGVDGWQTTALSPAAAVSNLQAVLFDTGDLSAVGIEDLQFNRAGGQQEETVDVDFIGPPGGPYTTLDRLPNEGFGSGSGSTLVGASADLSHAVLETEQHELAPGDMGQDPEGGRALYEWSDGRFQLVNVATDGALVSQCGAGLGMAKAGSSSDHNAVSSDGSKIFFTAPDPPGLFGAPPIAGPGCWNEATDENPPQVYMRVDGASTVEISEPNRGVHDPGGTRPAVFLAASANGSKAFFMSEAELTAGDPAHNPELYEYDAEAPEGERLIRVSGGESGTAEGNVVFVSAISNDGSEVYFGAYGTLAKGASAGPVNLYRYDTITRTTTYIAALSTSSYDNVESFDCCWYDIASALRIRQDGGPSQALLTDGANWYTTGNGEYLLFASTASLTGYDNDGVDELFRYSAADNSIVCVSCAGGLPVSGVGFNREDFEDTRDFVPLRPMSEDGSYVFFETSNALVPNTTDKTLHVYEWHNGKISLISSPDDQDNAFFLGSTPDGSNVFFGTHAQLVPQDTDSNGDVYDARIDGGFVGLTSAQCTGTGCQGVPAAPPIFATPASVTFEGVGNFSPGTETSVTPKPKAKTKAQKRARALKVCRGDRAKRKRVRCEASARARYARAHKSSMSPKMPGRGN
jgi:hypothetical protein